jgi:hypothetical protein
MTSKAYIGNCADDKLAEYLGNDWPISGDCENGGRGKISRVCFYREFAQMKLNKLPFSNLGG